MNSLEVMEFLVEKFGFKMKYNHTVIGSGEWSHAAVHDDGERLVEVYDGGAPSSWLGMRINGEPWGSWCDGELRLMDFNTKEKILHEFKKLGFIPNEKTLTPCEIQDYLVANYGFQRSHNPSGWGYYIYNTYFNKDLFHSKNARFLGFGNRVSLTHGDDVYESINTIPALKAFADKHFTKEVLMKEKILHAFEVVDILIRDYGFTRAQEKFGWNHAIENKKLQLNFHHDFSLSLYCRFEGKETGYSQLDFMNTEEKISQFMKLITKGTEKEEILTPADILNLAVKDYGFVLGSGSTAKAVNWDKIATLKGDNLVKLFYCPYDSSYVGTEFNGVQPSGSGWDKYKELNTARKFHAWCRLNNINPIPKTLTPDEILSPSEIITLAQAEYGFKPVKELSANGMYWSNMVALESFKRVVLFNDLGSDIKDWIGVEVNGEYKIKSLGSERWKALNTKAKFATWFKSLNIKKETTLDTNLSVSEIFFELENNHGFKVAKNSQVFEGSCKWGYVASRGAVTIYCERLEDEWINGRVNGTSIGVSDFVRSLLNTKHKINIFVNRHFAICGVTQRKLPVAKNDFKVGDKIVDRSNNSYLIVSEFITTGIKMFTLQGVNTGSFYTQHATLINCAYTKEKQPILWTTMADGAKIKGTCGRGCYTIIRKWWTPLKNVEAKEAGHYYILSFNGDVLISGADCVNDYLEYANKHNLE